MGHVFLRPESRQVESAKVKQVELPGVGSILSEEWRKGVDWRPHH